MAHDLLVADKQRVVIGRAGGTASCLSEQNVSPLVDTNIYGRGSNSMSPFRIARMAACVRS